ncbi:MAG: neocarzinostatin apoprotein domain-containing protein [Acidimicrobiales bacterium]
MNLIITGSGFLVVKDIPLSFASTVASAPPPTISVTSGPPYTAGEVVTIMGAHFPPSAPVVVGECPQNIDCGQWLINVTTDANGNFSSQFTLQSVFTTNVPVNGETAFSCTPGSGCVIQAGVTTFPEGAEIPVAVSP